MVLLRWWFLVVAEVAGLCAGALTGALQKLWSADVTHLSTACLVLLLGTTGFVGWITKQATSVDKYDRGTIIGRRILDPLQPHINAAWFISEVLMGLGMVGTIFGFLIMLNDAFTGSMQAQEVMARAGPGLGTMCVTTAVGLICSMFVKAQLVNLNYLVPDK